MPIGQVRNRGVAALARELGVSNVTISRQLSRGMSPAEIRANAAQRAARVVAGIGVRGGPSQRNLKDAEKAKERGAASSRVAVTARATATATAPTPAATTPPADRAKSLQARLRAVADGRPLPPSRVKSWGQQGGGDGTDSNSVDAAPAPDLIRDVFAESESESAPAAAAAPETHVEALRRKEVALANLKEVELAQRRGDLIPLVQVNAWFSGCIVSARDILLRIGPELRDRLAACVDPVVCERMVDEEVRRALGKLRELDLGEGAVAHT